MPSAYGRHGPGYRSCDTPGLIDFWGDAATGYCDGKMPKKYSRPYAQHRPTDAAYSEGKAASARCRYRRSLYQSERQSGKDAKNLAFECL